MSGEGELKKRQRCAESEPLIAVARVRTECPPVCVERARGVYYRYENSRKSILSSLTGLVLAVWGPWR